jgi:hypothetical protein
MPSYICATCGLDCPTYNTLIEHGIKAHAEKVLDPGNEFSSPNAKKLEGIIAWLRKQPDANLKTGEGKLLLDEIDRLTGELHKAKEDGIIAYRNGRSAGYAEHQDQQRGGGL